MEAKLTSTIANKFVHARRNGVDLPDYPGDMPQALDTAYAIQDEAIALFARSVGGWKVGRIMPPFCDQYGVNRLSGPIFDNSIQYAVPGGENIGYIFRDGFGAIEAEFIIRIGRTIRAGQHSYSLDDVGDLVDAVHVGMEVASSPYPGINDAGPLVTISDFGNNNGIIIAAAIPDWRHSGFADWAVSLTIDGAQVGEGKAITFPDGPLGSVRFLLENLSMRGMDVPEGTWVSTGAITGVHKVAPGQFCEARFGDALGINCTIEAVSV